MYIEWQNQEIFNVCRVKMDELDKLKNLLMQEWQTTEREDKCLREYQSEMEQLLQEKMSHVEELRLIHADINMVSFTNI